MTLEVWPLAYGLRAEAVFGDDDRPPAAPPAPPKPDKSGHPVGCKCPRCLELYGPAGRFAPGNYE